MPCPRCRAETPTPDAESNAYRPFCSERCKLLDLGKWLDGGYVLSRPMTPDEAWEAMSEPRDDARED